ncbi:MAG: GNAT family N-acetyltransferase [Vibrio sp.]
MHLATKKLFSSDVICCLDAASQDGSTGPQVIEQLLKHDYRGCILPVSHNAKSARGILCYDHIHNLPKVPDLAIFCQDKPHLLAEIESLIELGCSAILCLGPSFNQTDERKRWRRIAQLCHQKDVLFFGPTQFGLIFPHHHLHASLCPVPVNKGNIAFISHSQSMCQHVIDWAYDKNVGLSACLSLAPEDTHSLALWLDTLSLEPNTQAIVLYLNEIRDARAFMSAARSASYLKKILVLHPLQHITPDECTPLQQDAHQQKLIFDSMIARSGMLRVYTTHELFAALGTLNHEQSLKNDKGIIVLSNSQALTNMSMDAFGADANQIRPIDAQTAQALQQTSDLIDNRYLQQGIIHLSPLATPKTFIQLLDMITTQKLCSAVLILHSPSAHNTSDALAGELISQRSNQSAYRQIKLLTHLAGEYSAKHARSALSQAKIPSYRTPEGAVCAYLHLVHYRQNQIQLRETPLSVSLPNSKALDKSRQWLKQQLEQSQNHWTSSELGEFLSFYQINLLPSFQVTTLDEAQTHAKAIDQAVVLKIWGNDPTLNRSYTNVKRFLMTPNQIEQAYDSLTYKMAEKAELNCKMFVQPMVNQDRAVVARVRIRVDPVFGPVIFLGQMANMTQPSQDIVVALLPLNMALAKQLIIDLLRKLQLDVEAYPDIQIPVELPKLLVKLSQMMLDHPQIKTFDCQCMVGAGTSITLVDAHMSALLDNQIRTKFAIKPYPIELEKKVPCKSGSIFLRPIKPEDEANIDAFIQSVNPEDRYKRFFSSQQKFNHDALAKLTQIDYDREMALLALSEQDEEKSILGVVRIIREPQTNSGEFSVLINSKLKGQGIGKALMLTMLDYAKQRGFDEVKGITMPTNQAMIGLAKSVGFTVRLDFEDEVAYLNAKI